jgi:hypothetical protein
MTGNKQSNQSFMPSAYIVEKETDRLIQYDLKVAN